MKPALLLLPALLASGPCLPAAEPAGADPKINRKFLDPSLDVAEWLQKFEVESREVFDAREAVLEACRIEPGMRVADVGAGTGLYTRLFAETVGEDGWVFAVDISPRFVGHIQERAAQEGHENITAVLCPQHSVSLPPGSIDLAFLCDTYHHFEAPAKSLASLHRALRPGGSLIVIDFHRIEGESSEWLLGHVRAGQEVFRKEIEEAGFEFVAEQQVPGLVENYFMRFRRPAAE